jgi:hypothetical protein
LDSKKRRHQALGHGGVTLMARISGLARSTIYHGLSDIRDNVSAPPGRVRRQGGGRKKESHRVLNKSRSDVQAVSSLRGLDRFIEISRCAPELELAALSAVEVWRSAASENAK